MVFRCVGQYQQAIRDGTHGKRRADRHAMASRAGTRMRLYRRIPHKRQAAHEDSARTRCHGTQSARGGVSSGRARHIADRRRTLDTGDRHSRRKGRGALRSRAAERHTHSRVGGAERVYKELHSRIRQHLKAKQMKIYTWNKSVS